MRGNQTLITLIAASCLLSLTTESLAEASTPPSSAIQTQGGSSEPGAQILEVETQETMNGIFQFITYLDANGDLHKEVLDLDGNVVDYAYAIDNGPVSIISEQLQDYIDSYVPGGTVSPMVQILVYLDDDPGIDDQIPQQEIEFNHDTGEIFIDGRLATQQELDSENDKMETYLWSVRQAIRAKRHSHLRALNIEENWDLTTGEIEELANSYEPISRVMHVDEIEGFANRQQHRLVALHLYEEPINAVTDALEAISVSTFAHPEGDLGWGIGVYMTEFGCPDSQYMTNWLYKRISGTHDTHSHRVGRIIRETSPHAYIYCKKNFSLPTKVELDTYTHPARIFAMNMSGGWCSNQYKTYDMNWDNFVYQHSIATINAAGNSTPYQCPGHPVWSPANGRNVIAVGNYDDATSSIAATSSYVNPTNTKHAKPELSAPGQDIFITGIGADSGTSFAAPFVTGMVADLMSSRSFYQLRPQAVTAALMAGAWDEIQGGFNKVGIGGADYFGFSERGGAKIWHGDNASFGRFASNDGYHPTHIDYSFTLPPNAALGRVRIVVAYLTRGTWTYNNRNNVNALGRDIDIVVTQAGTGKQWYSFRSKENWEVVEFTPPAAGTYRVSIISPSDRNLDTSANLRLGLAYRYKVWEPYCCVPPVWP